MKKLLLLLLFIPLISFSQVQQVNIRNERNLSLSPEKIKVRTPISVDLYNYTHIAIVDVDISNPGYPKKQWTNVYAPQVVIFKTTEERELWDASSEEEKENLVKPCTFKD